MWYFAAKADLAYLERFKKTLTNYLSVRDRVEEMEPRYRTLAARGLLQSDEFPQAVKHRDELREKYTQEQGRAFNIAKRCGTQVVYSVMRNNGYVLQQAQMDVYTTILESGVIEPEQAEVRALDTLNRSIGLCRDRSREELWHLVNPLYWLYATFHSILLNLGLVAKLGEQKSTFVSKALVTVSIGVIAELVKDPVAHWLKHIVR